MTAAVAFTISPEAAAYVKENGLEDTLQKMLDHIPMHFKDPQAIAVSMMTIYDENNRQQVIVDVTRPYLGPPDDPSDRLWDLWLIETFPPEKLEKITVLSNF
jgi:hypothetical protein